MLSRFFGKTGTAAGDKSAEAPDTRGLEVVEEDPDTAWNKWAEAVAEQESGYATTERQDLSPEIDSTEAITQPSPLPSGVSREQFDRDVLRDRALSVVATYHLRIANTIRDMWAHRDCGAYINRLIMEGGDGMGQARVGFHQEAVEAMLALSDLHDAEFGTQPDGFTDSALQQRRWPEP